MGLDVYFAHPNGEYISFHDRIMEVENGFPFAQSPTTIPPVYNEYDEVIQEESVVCDIVEINGMSCVGSVSFRGRWYDDFVSQVAQIPYSFYRDMSPEELKEQASAFSSWLEDHQDVPDEQEFFGIQIGRIRNLSKLLNWAVEHGLGTEASY
ncbi:MAG TPA: hypothetical protein VH593_07105 [Ktedonobacteraceae bacterium]